MLFFGAPAQFFVALVALAQFFVAHTTSPIFRPARAPAQFFVHFGDALEPYLRPTL